MTDDLNLQRRKELLTRQLKYKRAKDNIVPFIEMMMPDPEDPDDIEKTMFKTPAHSMLLCDMMEKMEAGDRRKTAVSIAPQMGKTTIIAQFGLAWIWGRNPTAKIVCATYSQDRANELGDMFKLIIDNPLYKQIFPDFALNPSSKSKRYMINKQGGSVTFAGANTAITGKTAHYFFIDDPYKGIADEFTPEALKKTWDWFYNICYSRGGKRTRYFIVHTRWHEDDLIGRLCDPEHPERNGAYEGLADDWLYINIPGVITQEKTADMLGLEMEIPLNPKVRKAFGSKPMVALWEEEKDLEFYATWKKGNPVGFSALVMGNPTPDDGAFFLADWIVEYSASELPPPEKLRFYAASDHAVSIKQDRDFTVLGIVGIDENDDIWVMPDCFVDRVETPETVENIIRLAKKYKPQVWFMENELIMKSFGPFLRKRMQETNTYFTIWPITPSKDKKTRARSIQGRMQMKKVRFPRYAHWWNGNENPVRAQLLRFPNATHDDFVDFLAHIGAGLDSEIPMESDVSSNDNGPSYGTIEYIMYESQLQKADQQQEAYAWN